VSSTRLTGVLFLVLACVLVFAAPEAAHTDALGDPGPTLLPRVVGVCMGLLAVLLFLQDGGGTETRDEVTEKPSVIVPSLLAIPVFYLLFQFLGYTFAVGLYLLAAFYLLGAHHRAAVLRYLLAAAAFSLATGMVFVRLLDLPLPGVLP
jgi:hypothetical protein